MMDHSQIVATYPDRLIEDIITDLGKRNLRDYSQFEVRWSADRLSACRRERKRRKALKS